MATVDYFSSSSSSNSTLLILIIATTIPLFLFLINKFRRRNRHVSTLLLPPGPPGWPVIGNLLDLGTMPHRTLTQMTKTHGDVVYLRLGAMKTMAILSTNAAADFFKNHDLDFADRTVTEIMKVHGYDKGSVALAPYGPYWRVLRKLVTVDMLVAKRINGSYGVRRKCVDNMIRWVGEESDSGSEIHVARFVFLTTFNLLGNLMLSKDLLDSKSEEGKEFFEAMMGLMEWGGHANVADIFPWLKWMDPQGLCRKMRRDLGKAMEIASKFVKERLENGGGGDSGDFLDVLLGFQGNGKDEPEKISHRDIHIFILEIFMAGSETTSSTTEWALTELLRHPESMTKVQTELKTVIGPNRKMEETDIENLPFLQAVVKETFRLHPPIPLLVPRRAMRDTTFMGYHVPKDTQVLVNAWSIGRDPSQWEDPWSFKPDRFLGSKVDYRGQHYQFLPFGAGRRMCAGVPLAHRVLHLILGTLLHEFSWEAKVDPSTFNMDDRLGITMRKSESLMVVPKKRGRV
ncbi:Cytochrome P450 76A2 [Linum perenne]